MENQHHFSLGHFDCYNECNRRLYIFLHHYRTINAQARAKLVKNPNDLLGKRLTIQREQNSPVAVNIYMPNIPINQPLPVVFNIHGGGFVGGDADVLDTQSQRLANEWQSMIVAINYTKADVKPIDYGSEEIKDTILYFAHHAQQYQIDKHRFSLMGYSAGTYYALNASKQLKQDNFPLFSVILCYPWLTGFAQTDLTQDYPPILFILAGQDPISQNAKPYFNYLQTLGAKVDSREYPEAVHSFIESNNPEGNIDSSVDMSAVINTKQHDLAKQAENHIDTWIKGLQ